MSYQALLFCPDEKTARTVTQVLSELDFVVTPCTEPFAAVKKLMNEHFDAVVVDCDNEQNATLLFKSARNAPNNQSSLAVAVVEGQAGVAKAFRIGANLVLTKPINVEQAKGTLRVARGLLRKSEGAKTAPAATSMTAKSAPVPVQPAQQPTIPNSRTQRPAEPVAPVIAARTINPPTPKPEPQHSPAASASADILEDAPLESVSAEAVSPQVANHSIEPAPKSIASPVSSGASAASAVAPAREAKVTAAPKAVTAVPEVVAPVKKSVEAVESKSSSETLAPAPFSFGGMVGSGAEVKQGGSKKALVAAVAVVVIAAGAYGAWMQWGHSQESSSAPAHLVAPPIPAPASQNAEKAATLASAPATAPPSPDGAQPGAAAKRSDEKPASAGKAKAHANQSDATVAPKPSSIPDKTTVAKSIAPIVIKNHAGKSGASNEAPLSITSIASAGSGGTLPNLMGTSKAPTPTLQRLNISQGVSRGLLIKQVQPSYPSSALRMRIEGAVQLVATLAKNGDISEVKVLSGDPQLAQAALTAVKQWKYKPYLLNGEPVEVQTQITVNFKLPR